MFVIINWRVKFVRRKTILEKIAKYRINNRWNRVILRMHFFTDSVGIYVSIEIYQAVIISILHYYNCWGISLSWDNNPNSFCSREEKRKSERIKKREKRRITVKKRLFFRGCEGKLIAHFFFFKKKT